MSPSRRTLFRAGLTMGSVGLLGAQARPAAAKGVPKPPIHPRDDWAADLAPVGEIQPEDPLFILVHHSASPNTDAPGGTPERLRSFFDFHTTTRGWPDVAYNFFVDRWGEIWEGRRGSLTGPVAGDATGGSQGHAQLVCFVGDFATEPPPAKALDAMTSLIAWLAMRDGIALDEQVEFTSRGSTSWPAGETVRTAAVAAHRDMSETTCPGDALYPLVAGEILPGAQRIVAAARTPSPASTPEGAVETPAASGTPAGPIEPRSGLDHRWLWGGGAVTLVGSLALWSGLRRRAGLSGPGGCSETHR